MAFNEFQIEELKKIEGFGKGFEAGEKTAAGAMGDIALMMIPGMGTVKLARSGGKLTKAAMDFVKRAKKMYPNAKLNPKPTAAQVSNAKPMSGVTLKKPSDVAVSALKPRPRATAPGGKPTTTAAPKPKVRVPAGKPKQAPKAADKPKPTPPRAPGLAKNRQRVDGKPTAAKPAPKPAPKPKPNAAAAKKRAAAQRKLDALLATAVAAGAASKAVAPTKPKKSEDRAKDSAVSPKPKPKRKTIKVTQDRSAKQSEAAAKGMPTVRPRPKPKRKTIKVTQDRSAKQSEAAAKGKPTVKSRPKPVTAGKNVGFGPKGNIFPKNAADRARLMKLYGGTGSAAAKAAAAGKQGTLKKGKK